MRITNSLFYATSAFEHQNAMKKMYDINNQMASGMKIQNSYEDSGVFVDTMRLNYEIATLEQTKETSSKAQTFAQNTDATMNQFEEALEQFKTKLIQASNASNSSTSLGALADELESLKKHMLSLGNTSINGQFLFSGSSLLVKPLNADGSYNGNDEQLNAIVGSGVEIPYNIDGKSLFLGRDNDYNKIVSTNIEMFNQSKLNPNVMVEKDGNLYSQEIYLTEDDTIRDLVGDTNENSSDDPKAVFYLSGRKSDGKTFSQAISIDTSSKVSDLLESIGTAYGNTTSNKVVDVSMNARGQIEVKDLKQGNQLLEMNLFGAIDRAAVAGSEGDALNKINADEILRKPSVDIIAFNKSFFDTTLSSPNLAMSTQTTATPNQFTIGETMLDKNGNAVLKTTLLSSFMPIDVDHIDFGATSFSIAGQTVQDLMTAIESEYSLNTGDATLVAGQIVINDTTVAPTLSTFSTAVTLIPKNSLNVPAQGDPLPDAMNYARRGFEKDGNELTSNISQIVKKTNAYATASTKLIDVAGVDSLNGKQFVLEFTDVNGVQRSGTLNFDATNTTFSLDLNSDGDMTDENETFSIYNGKNDLSNVTTAADEMTYQQLMDIVSMTVSGKLPKLGVSTASKIAIDNAIAAGIVVPSTPISLATLATETATAKIGVSQATAEYIQKAIDAGILKNTSTDLAVIAQASQDYDDAIVQANLQEYNYAVHNANNIVDVSLDYKGRLNIVDKNTSKSNIEFTMYDKSATDFTGVGSTALSFMANDAVTISNPTIDFFKDLDQMIEAVRTGNFRMGDNADDPRNIGIQNSISQLDHILDHVTKMHTKIGAYSNALQDSSDRATYLSLNVKTVRSSVIDVDTAEAYLQFNQISTSYQAMLSTIAKINSLSLLNYM